MSDDEEFFYEHAGWSYDPSLQSSENGRRESAQRLALAEAQGRAAGFWCVWDLDYDYLSSERIEDGDDGGADRDPWPTWECRCYGPDAPACAIASLGGIDFGRDGSPLGQPYKRVIEAELAQEAISVVQAQLNEVP